jgi:hypothetical protein
MKLAISTLKSAVWALPLLALSSCFGEGDGYTNVVIPGVAFEIDSLPGDTLYFKSPQRSSQTLLVKTNQRDWTSYVVSGSNFCSVKKAGGISVSVTENEAGFPRTAEVSLKAGDQTYRLYVYQKGAAYLDIDPSAVEVDNTGGEKKIVAKSNFEWDFAQNSAGAWCTATRVQQKPLSPDAFAEYEITITVSDRGSAAAPRKTEITFTSQEEGDEYQRVVKSQKIVVTQN